MHNIKQKFLKFTVFLSFLFCVSGCETAKKENVEPIPDNKFVEIALILPMSGPDADLGREYAKMIKLGLSDGLKSKIRIISYDSASQETLAESLVKISEHETDIVIGPIYSEPTRIVAEKLKGKKPVIISLSNNPVLAEPNVFMFGHAPMRQLQQLTDYFLANNYQNYLTLMPNGRHSTMVSAILKDAITKQNATLSTIEFYDNTNSENIDKSLQKISDVVDDLNENDINLTQSVVVLADDPATLKSMLQVAKRLNLDKKAVLAGDNRIDINDSANLTFTSSLEFLKIDFPAKAKAQDIKSVNFMHALAYDAGKMIGEYIGTSFNKADFIAKINSSSFKGVSGTIKFTDSIAMRKYDIIQKENGVYKAKSQ